MLRDPRDLDDAPPPPRPLCATKFDFRGMCKHGPEAADQAQKRRLSAIVCSECGNLLVMSPEGIWYVAERATERATERAGPTDRVGLLPLSREQGITLDALDPSPENEPTSMQAPGALRLFGMAVVA